MTTSCHVLVLVKHCVLYALLEMLNPTSYSAIYLFIFCVQIIFGHSDYIILCLYTRIFHDVCIPYT